MPKGAATTGLAARFIASGLLEAAYDPLQVIPLALLRHEQHQHEIGADAEILAVVGDDHRLEIPRRLLDAGVDHGHRVVADRVHLAVELQAEHAVSQIDQRSAGDSF